LHPQLTENSSYQSIENFSVEANILNELQTLSGNVLDVLEIKKKICIEHELIISTYVEVCDGNLRYSCCAKNSDCSRFGDTMKELTKIRIELRFPEGAAT